MAGFSLYCMATTYYISNTGNDANSGLTTALPWKTLAKVNAATFKAGDQILFQKGDTFYGTLIPKNSGIEGNPITFGAYGTGANPIITGFTTVAGWTDEGGGIYSKVITSESQTNMVTIDGVQYGMGRYPNTTYLTYESASANVSITDNTLGDATNWIGAEALIIKNAYTIDRCTITNHTSNTLTYMSIGSARNADATGNYFIQNDLRTLDQFGEWYHNTSTGKFYMFFGATSPTTKTVRVATLNNVCKVNYAIIYNTLDYLSFSGTIKDAISAESACHYLTVQNCDILFAGLNGIWCDAQNVTINACTFDYCNRISILSVGINATITNNSISNNAIIVGQGNVWLAGISAVYIYSNNPTVLNNIIRNTATNGILLSSLVDVGIIKNNYIYSTCLLNSDHGSIYTDGSHTALVIDGNLIIKSLGSGIYLDEYSTNIEVKNNSISECAIEGIKLHKANNNVIKDNIVYNCQIGFGMQNWLNEDNLSNNTLTGNILVAKKTTQYPFRYITRYTSYTTTFTTLTFNNNYYTRPIDDINTINTNLPSLYDQYKTLAQWQTVSVQDANSKKSPQSITNENDLQFEYNETKSAKTVSLSQPMIDVKGTKYVGSITLQPFTSVVLMKDLTPAVVPGTPTSVVATAGNASASVTFVAPLSNGGSAITGYTVTSIPAGGVDANAGSTSLTHTITGLTNGASYTFTVKATNSVGTSVASSASNSVTPKAPVATGFLFIGPSSGNVNSASANFTVTPDNPYTGTITITPTGTGSEGLSAKVLTFSSSSTAQTFSITPTAAGSISLAPTNNGSLTNPAILTYAANAVVPAAPTSVVAIAGNTSASVSFVAPANNGGSAITGYTVTSIPAGGTDVNAGSTSLTHTITGLTNGTSYTFTVKATNSAGTSLASVASNPVIPSAPTEYSQILELKKGYNMISTYVAPSDPVVIVVTQPIVADGNLIKIQDESGNSYENWGSFGGWINNLGSFQQTEGYKIKVAENCTLQVTGHSIALPLDIPLNAGWNIISFPRTDALDAMMIIQSLIDQNKLIKVQDETGNSIEDWGVYGGWKNGIGNFVPGKAYRVKMSASAVLTIQQNYTKSANTPVYSEKTSYFSSQAEGNGVDHMNINIIGLREAGLSAGDELAAFDGDVCVGTLKITNSNLTLGTASLIASSSTGSQHKDGFKDGASVQLYVWNQISGLESKVEAAAIKGSLNYLKNASILVKMKSLTTTVAPQNANMMQTEVFPNPSQGRFTVRFSELPEAGSRIEVLDLSGRKVASRLITGISEELNLYGQAAGLYLVKSILGSSEKIQKLVIQ